MVSRPVALSWSALLVPVALAWGTDIGGSRVFVWHGLAMAAAALMLATTKHRTAAGAVALVALVAQNTGAASTQTVLIFWVSLAIALFAGRELSIAARTIAACLYVFAAAEKMFPPFLSGEVLARDVPWMPGLRVVAVLVIAVELSLGLLVLIRPRLALAPIVAFHVPVAFFMGRDAGHVVVLIGYGLMMAWLTLVACPALGRLVRDVPEDLVAVR